MQSNVSIGDSACPVASGVSGTKGCPAAPLPDSDCQGTRAHGAKNVSVIVPCRNEVKSIRTFLESLRRQNLGGLECEVIIADGLSDDGTREVLFRYSQEHPWVRVIDNRDRIVSTGLNAAIRAAQGEIIIRMDVHTEYQSDYIRRCVEVLERTKAANVGGPWIARGKGYVGRAIAAAFQSAFAVGGARGHQANHEGLVDTVYLGCWRRDLLLQIGLFDETLVRNQDDELNLRLARAGEPIYQSPQIVSWYQARPSLTGLFRQYFQYGFWKVAVIQKHRLPASWRHLVPGAFVLTNLAFLGGAFFRLVAGIHSLMWPLAAWAAMDFAYALSSVGAALLVARRAGWTLFPLLPVVFAIYHAAYGLGFVAGIYSFSSRGPHRSDRETVFTEITR